MEYKTRSLDYFLHSILYLKSQSGGQRWNAICEDAVELFFDRFPKEIENPFTRETLWQFLFEPSINPQFASLCKDEAFLDFFFLILQALLDPPAYWWRNSSTTSTK